MTRYGKTGTGRFSMPGSELSPLYLITDRKRLPRGSRLPEYLEPLLQAGLTLLQLREKDLDAARLYSLAKEVRTLTQDYGCRLLINDRIDIALAVNADGVHLGHHSLPIAQARKVLGPAPLIGASTHSLSEALSAQQQGADFLTCGPVFPTASKTLYGAPLGLNQVAQIQTQVRLPVYALGGISLENLTDVSTQGLAGFALISALQQSVSPAADLRRMLEIWHQSGRT